MQLPHALSTLSPAVGLQKLDIPLVSHVRPINLECGTRGARLCPSSFYFSNLSTSLAPCHLDGHVEFFWTDLKRRNGGMCICGS